MKKNKGKQLIGQTGLTLMLLFMSLFTLASISDVVDDIASSVKSSNTKALTKHFSSTVSMSLLNDEGVYSRVQAEIILRDFFNKNTPTSVKFVHRLDSNPNFKYVVLMIGTSHDNYRLSYKLINEDNSFKITEFRIEPIY